MYRTDGVLSLGINQVNYLDDKSLSTRVLLLQTPLAYSEVCVANSMHKQHLSTATPLSNCLHVTPI